VSGKVKIASAGSLMSSLLNNRSLIFQMTKRDILSKYKGSAIGVLWSLINPILMLVYIHWFFLLCLKLGGEMLPLMNQKHSLLLFYLLA
jgi:lipopolysaccharide transport system permease protein